MKINLYFTLVSLLFFSLVQAQEPSVLLEKKQIKETPLVLSNIEITDVNEPQTVLIDELALKSAISRIDSDIKLYFKRQKKVSNISFVFPKMNLEALS